MSPFAMNYRKTLLFILVLSTVNFFPAFASVQPEPEYTVQVSVSRDTIILGGSITDDGGMILAGKRILSGNSYALLMKVSETGVMAWEKTYGDGDDYLTDVKQTDNGNYVAVGTATNDGEEAVWVIRTSASGTLNWEYTHAFANSYGESLIEDKDGRIAWAGQRLMEGDMILFYGLLDADGNEITYNNLFYPEEAYAKKIIQTIDGGYLIAGDGVQDNYLGRQVLFLKLDSDFKQDWSELYGGPNEEDVLYDVLETPAGNYAAFSGHFDKGYKGVILEANKTGDIQYYKNFKVPSYFTGKGLVRLGDEDYVYVGVINGDINTTYIGQVPLDTYQPWELEITANDVIVEAVGLVGDSELLMAGTITLSLKQPAVQKTSSIADPPCSLKVTVRDTEGSPIRGADVAAVTKMDVGISGTTNTNGEALFDEVTPGTHTIQISANGYETETTSVECPSGESVSIIIPLMNEETGTETEPETDPETDTETETSAETETSDNTDTSSETETGTETDTETQTNTDTSSETETSDNTGDQQTTDTETDTTSTTDDTEQESEASNNNMLYIGGAIALVGAIMVAYYLGTRRN
ncbi:MAG: carboxypeptidase-like regulatory domain-containing protein [Candidatus Bathyarchaeota archaeon]|nr:carboxypeptidase-like regulatory domain-containing protein [Candidatus Bathyarchaeota archaeon]